MIEIIIIEKVLKFLFVLQEKRVWINSNKCYYVYRRINPFNPLTYVLVSIMLPMYILKSTIKELKELKQAMKWD